MAELDWMVAKVLEALDDHGLAENTLLSLVDIMATTGDILDVELPEGAGPDSYSFLHALTGSEEKGEVRNEILYQSLDGVLAVRQSSWVLIPVQGNGNTLFR